MKVKLKIDTNGAPDGKYGPFYVLCDVVIESGEAVAYLSEDARVDDHIYRFVQEDIPSLDGSRLMNEWRMRLTRSITGPVDPVEGKEDGE